MGGIGLHATCEVGQQERASPCPLWLSVPQQGGLCAVGWPQGCLWWCWDLAGPCAGISQASEGWVKRWGVGAASPKGLLLGFEDPRSRGSPGSP